MSGRPTDEIRRGDCPNCGDETEFVQFANGSEETTATTAEEVGDGLLELRICDCGVGVENVLEISSQRTFGPYDG